jgi:ATP-binding cassette, subfamily B, bacterial
MTGAARTLRPYVAGQWPALAAAAAAAVFIALAELARPFPLALVVDRLFAGFDGPFELQPSDLRLLAAIALLVLAIALVDSLAVYVSELLLKKAGERITHDLRVAVYAHLQKLSLTFHDRRQKGDLVTRVTGDVNAVGQLFSESLGTMAQALLLLAGMLVVTLLLDPLLALVAFAPAPLLAAVTVRYRRRIKQAARRQRATEGEIASLADEALSAMQVVKAFGSESYEHERVSGRSEARRRIGVELSRLESRFTGLIDVIGALGTALVITIGVLRVATGALTPGELIVFASYSRRLYRPLRDIARQASRISRGMARAERIAELLSTDEALEERASVPATGRAQGEIELDDVSFWYTPDRPALEGISLRVEPCERVAIVGRSGAGKSTVGALMARFYDPDRGRVLIDGRDARDYELSWLRAQVGILLQDSVLFSGTVAENIAYGTDAGREDVIEAAKAAAAHEFIVELPDGYDTPLGPRGVGLSGGQRQRIGIARTLLRDPAILVLDEPTTGLDPRSEKRVLDGLRSLMKDRTTIMVTHSPQLARSADRVVVVDAGRVADEGSCERATSASRMRAGGPLHDPALPELPRLLDAAQMAPVLERSLGRDVTISDARGVYLRYKPGTNLRVHYQVAIGEHRHEAVVMIAAGADLARRAGKPHNVALARTVNGRSPAAFPLVHDEEVDALVQWLPLDLSLPGLVEPPARLRERLRRAGVAVAAADSEPPRLAYRPRRRAVLRVDGHVLKAYASEQRYRAAESRLRAISGRLAVPTAPFAAALPDLRVTVQPFLHGHDAASARAIAREAGSALRELHGSQVEGLDRFPPARQQAAVATFGAMVKAVAPHLEGRVDSLVERLGRTIPEELPAVPSHGDFHVGQLRCCDDAVALIDFDEMTSAPPALDLGTYAAHELWGDEGDLAAAREILEELLEGYGSRPEGLDWYFSALILRRSSHPFRRFHPDWPGRVEAMVAAAESALER